MANTAFVISSGTTLTAQPNPAGEKLIARSTQAADTGNLTVSGVVGSSGTSETNALTGKREKQTSASFKSLSQALLSAGQTGVVTVRAQGTKATGLIIVSTQPANNDTVLLGLTGFEQTYTFKTSLTGSANEILIGAAASNTADNLKRAINNDGTAGTNYGTGTVANAYVSATVSGQIITITDLLACARQLAWSLSQGTGATLSLSAPTGGIDGAILASLAIAVTQAFNQVSLNSEDIVATTLPAKVAPPTAAVFINGKSCTLRFKMAAVSAAISLKYQTSTDGVNWSDGASAITNLGTSSITIAAPYYVTPSEANIDQIRLVFTANTNTSDTPLDARVIY